MTKKTILTGIKPTGTPHLGNYLGMIKPTLELCAANAGHDNYLFLANYHSLNSVQNAADHRQLTYDLCATLLGCGLDPNSTTMFLESDVPEIAELTNFLMYVTPKGLMDRAHAFKAALDENRAKGAEDNAGIYMGLYTYPILMAADILMFNTTHVPVGKDQVQHVEFARDIAGYFNNTFGQTFPLPEHVVQADTATVPGLDGRKMSKSYDNVVPIFAPEKEIVAAVKRIVTDSKRPEEAKDPETNTIYQIYKAIAGKASVDEMAHRFRTGAIGYGDAKQLLADRIVAEFKDRYAKFEHFRANRAEIDAVLQAGAAKARAKAQEVIIKVRKAVGVI